MEDSSKAVDELEDRVTRYPKSRYPVLHARAQFHFGVALADAGRLDDAERALTRAALLFHSHDHEVDHGKANNALGAVLRLTGRLQEAEEAFTTAAEALERSALRLEHGASRFNLGLVQRDLGDYEGAIGSFERARDLLQRKVAPAQAAAVQRELGATLLLLGRLDEATAVLRQAVDIADETNDFIGLGAAWNTLGLTHLAAARLELAIEAFTAAAGASPMSVRPEAFAMAKSNLALAHERAGELAPARSAARQALAIRAAADPVVEQAAGVLERLGDEPGDLHYVLDQQQPAQWPAIVREEVVRWVDAGSDEQRAEAKAWIEGALERFDQGEDRAEAWVGALLELPPEGADSLIRSTIEALMTMEPSDQDRFRSDVSSAMARFHLPQWMRLRDAFNRIAGDLGEGSAWM